MTPRVSVVIPAYNNAAYIVETVESVLAQDYDDFELIAFVAIVDPSTGIETNG